MLQKIDSLDGDSKLYKELLLDESHKTSSSPKIHRPEKNIDNKKRSFSPSTNSHLMSHNPKKSNYFFQKFKLALNGKKSLFFMFSIFFIKLVNQPKIEINTFSDIQVMQ